MTSSKPPTLAIVIPIYGHPSLLIDALESALRQETNHEYRIVLVNDGCPSPQTEQICRQYAQTHPTRILYVKKRNGGLSSARNCGIQVVLDAWPSVRAIYLLDADNRLHPHLLERAYGLLQANPEAGWIFPDVHMFGSSREFCDTTGEFTRLQLLADNYCEAGSMVRREVFEAGVRYDESMKLGFEDWEFWLQAVAAGFKGKHGPALGFQYRKRAESMLANSLRDQREITGYIRRKHAQLFTPRMASAFEREELPRFALYLADCAELILTSDVGDLSRRQTWTEFTRALRRHETQPRLQAVPPTLIVTCSATLELLNSCGLAANLLWLLEADLEDRQLFLLQLEQRMNVEVRLEITVAGNPDLATRNQAVLCAIPTTQLVKWLRESDLRSLLALMEEDGSAQVIGRRFSIERLERPLTLQGGAARQLCETVRRLQSEYRTKPHPAINTRRRFYRTALDAGHIARRVFEASASPPLGYAAGERRLGFVASQIEAGAIERVVCNIASELRRQDWRVHLFVVGAGRACLPAEFKEVFDSIHLVPDQSLGQPERLVSLLGTMQVVINHHNLPLHAALGALKRLGVKLVSHLHHVEHSPDGMPGGSPYLASDYEHSLHRIVVASRSLQTFLIAKAVPAEKIICVPPAPSFELAPERIEAALAERSLRVVGEPLRVLFLADDGRPQECQRLIELVTASERRVPGIKWRIVGNLASKSGKRLPIEMSLLEKYRYSPAFDSFSRYRHFCWSDVFLQLSPAVGTTQALLDAQQLGSVPIVVNGAAANELIDQGVTGFHLKQVEDLLDLLVALQRDRERLLDVAKQAAQLRRFQSWRQTLTELTACLDAWFPPQGAA